MASLLIALLLADPLVFLEFGVELVDRVIRQMSKFVFDVLPSGSLGLLHTLGYLILLGGESGQPVFVYINHQGLH